MGFRETQEVAVMGAREKMIAYRKLHETIGTPLNYISNKLKISPMLLDMVENGHVTHPKIARRMQELYDLTEEEYEELVPEIHRKSSPKYDPDHYKASADLYSFAVPKKKGYEEDPYYMYINERRKRAEV